MEFDIYSEHACSTGSSHAKRTILLRFILRYFLPHPLAIGQLSASLHDHAYLDPSHAFGTYETPSQHVCASLKYSPRLHEGIWGISSSFFRVRPKEGAT